MLLEFFATLKRYGVPVTVRELLVLIEALEKDLAFANIDDFYLLARITMVKDEKYYDKYDRAFGAFFNGLDSLEGLLDALIPQEWLRKEFERVFTEEEKAQINSLGGLEKLLETLKQRLEEQKEKHKGGNKWIGTGGTSPFGHGGYNPEGVRVGGPGGQGRAVKVWDKREFANLDDGVELGTRNIKVALRRLRKFAREGAQDQLDLDDTIASTARNAGLLDIKMVPERHNAVKVLIFFDVGGSMDPFVRNCEALFSAVKTEFKHLEYFYFHNFLYDWVWKDNYRRHTERFSTTDILRTYGPDYKVIFVGDASMAPYEVTARGGSVEYMNEESGATWFKRVADKFGKLIWLNPVHKKYWQYTPTIDLINRLTEGRMYPLTIEGINDGIRSLSK